MTCFVIADGTWPEEVTVRYAAEGRVLKRSGLAAAIARRNPPVCFPSGPFCFSSINDFATLVAVRAPRSSAYLLPSSPPCCRSVIRVNRHLTASHDYPPVGVSVPALPQSFLRLLGEPTTFLRLIFMFPEVNFSFASETLEESRRVGGLFAVPKCTRW